MNYILKSDSIFDSISNNAFPGYIYIKDSVIEKIINNTLINYNPTIDNSYEFIDFGNKTITPGICDPHVHLYLGAINMSKVNLNSCLSEEEAAKAIYEFYKDKDDEWCLGFGWTHYKWPGEKLPTKHSLDKFFPNRPVLLFNDEIHAVWVNSKAMEICGIDKNTEEEIKNTIFKDDFGDPTGYLLEQPAMKIVSDIALTPNLEYEKSAIAGFIKGAHSRGVTSIGDVHVLEINKFEACKALEDENNLQLRIAFSPPIETSVETALSLKKDYNSDKLKFLGLKGFIDGVPLGYTGLLVEDYSEIPGFKGEAYLDLHWLKEKCEKLYPLQIPVRLHACGDGAVREVLSIVEHCQNIFGNLDVRNTVEHIECIHKDDLIRFKDLDIIASIQPSHMLMPTMEGHPIFNILGEERAKYTWLSKSLEDNGAKMAFGTDYPIVDLNPMETIHSAMTRRMEDGMPIEGFNPNEKQSLEASLKNVTINAAYLMKTDHLVGSLEEGKKADIAVWNKDLFSTSVENLLEIEAFATFFDGKKVY